MKESTEENGTGGGGAGGRAARDGAAAPSRNIVVVLTTPKRPQYLAQTLRDLDACGGHAIPRRVVAVDGPLRDVLKLRALPRGWELMQVGPGGRGNRECFANVCRKVAAMPGAGDLLFFEDDVTGCANALTALDRLQVPDDVGFIQAFDHRNRLPDATAPMLLRLATDEPEDGLWFWGNQALKIPSRTVAHLAQQPADRFVQGVAWDQTERSLTYGADVWLGAHAASSWAPWQVYGLIAPSLFQHTGGISAVNPQWRLTPGMWRIARNWRREFDGLTLVDALTCGTSA
ncbi:MAG TPA: hypothetical protein VFQ87_03095 [Bradyrhizobium sp.]|nr:hypothetical protein [Bradyrhizobium sp.]